MLEQRVQRQCVGGWPEASDSPEARGSNFRAPSEGLPSIRVREMKLDSRQATATHRVVDRVGGMRVRARVDQDAGETLVGCLTNPTNELTLVIRLPTVHEMPSESGLFRQKAVNLGKRRFSIDSWFTAPEPVQVGSAQDQYSPRRHGTA
jgi:hypothetical protein